MVATRCLVGTIATLGAGLSGAGSSQFRSCCEGLVRQPSMHYRLMRGTRFFVLQVPPFPRTAKQRMPGDKLHKLASIMGSRDAYGMYYRLASHWDQPTHIVNAAIEPHTLLTNGNHAKLANVAEQMMYFDSVTYLPDDILVKLDRATMAVSLEGRVPLLDHRVAEFAWKLPLVAACAWTGREVDSAPTSLQVCAPRTYRASENRLRHPYRFMAARPAPRLGRRSS